MKSLMKKRILIILFFVLCMVLITIPVPVTAEDVYMEINNFADLEATITNATGDLNLKLSDIYSVSTGTLTIAASNNYNITIDLNGKMLSGGNSGPAIIKEGSGTLTIRDSSGGYGKVSSAYGNANQGTIYLKIGAASDTVLKITGGTIGRISDLRRKMWGRDENAGGPSREYY